MMAATNSYHLTASMQWWLSSHESLGPSSAFVQLTSRFWHSIARLTLHMPITGLQSVSASTSDLTAFMFLSQPHTRWFWVRGWGRQLGKHIILKQPYILTTTAKKKTWCQAPFIKEWRALKMQLAMTPHSPRKILTDWKSESSIPENELFACAMAVDLRYYTSLAPEQKTRFKQVFRPPELSLTNGGSSWKSYCIILFSGVLSGQWWHWWQVQEGDGCGSSNCIQSTTRQHHPTSSMGTHLAALDHLEHVKGTSNVPIDSLRENMRHCKLRLLDCPESW